MSEEDKLKSRAKRFRDAQVSARDPGDSKIKGYDWKKHAAKPKRKPKPLLLDLFDVLPARWKGAFYGLLIGGVLGIILLIVLPPGDIRSLAIIPPLICLVVGMALGALFQDNTLKQ